MRNTPRPLLAAAVAAGLVSLLVHAASPPRTTEPGLAASADLLPDSRRRAQSMTARDAVAAKAVSDEDVGDADSFGRNLKWLGVNQMNIRLDPAACPAPDPASDSACTVLLPAPAATSFDFQDVARITLPGHSSKTILCHWLSPQLSVDYDNPTAGAVVARLSYTPTLTIENPVLDDPALIDATTGLPFGGRLLTSMTASERFEVPLQPGESRSSLERDSATCIAGFLTRRSLVDNYGLTPVLAKKFFTKATTIRMNLRGNAHYVGSASMIFGLRVIGD